MNEGGLIDMRDLKVDVSTARPLNNFFIQSWLDRLEAQYGIYIMLSFSSR